MVIAAGVRVAFVVADEGPRRVAGREVPGAAVPEVSRAGAGAGVVGEGDEIAVEWEWGGVWGNELKKLKNHRVSSPEKGKERLLKYGVLITYTHTPNIEKVYSHVMNEWEGARWPLLLILIDLEESKKFPMGKDFKNINVSIFDASGQRKLRVAPAFPWNVESSRWSVQTL